MGRGQHTNLGSAQSLLYSRDRHGTRNTFTTRTPHTGAGIRQLAPWLASRQPYRDDARANQRLDGLLPWLKIIYDTPPLFDQRGSQAQVHFALGPMTSPEVFATAPLQLIRLVISPTASGARLCHSLSEVAQEINDEVNSLVDRDFGPEPALTTADDLYQALAAHPRLQHPDRAM